MSQTIAETSSYEFKKDTEDRYYWYDIDDGSKVSEEAVLESFGHEPSQREAADAVWTKGDPDKPIRIIGQIGVFGGETFYKSEDDEMGIPESQLKWISRDAVDSSKEDLPDDPNELKDIIQGLRRESMERDRAHQAELASLEERLTADFSARMQKMQERFDEQIAGLESKGERPPAVIRENFLQRIRRRRRGESEEYDESGRPFITRDGQRVYIEKSGNGAVAGAIVGAVAVLATVALVEGCDNRDEGRDTDSRITIIEERQTEIAEDTLEVQKDIRTTEQAQAEEAEEANEIARDRLEVEERDLRAQRYGNRLQIKANQLLKRALERGSNFSIFNGSGGTENGSNVNVEQGYGFTQVIRDLFPGYTASQYYAAHLAAVGRFGPNYISRIPKYTTPSGELRLARPGGAVIRPGVRIFIEKQLKDLRENSR